MTDLDQRIAALREAVRAAWSNFLAFRPSSSPIPQSRSTSLDLEACDLRADHIRDEQVAEIAFKDAEIERMRADNAELETECEEGDALRMKLSAILTGVANALRGQPPALTSWSWHDLPERAAAAITAIDIMTRAARENGAEVERLRARVAELEESRMDVIGSNGNDGEHYREVGPTPLRGRVTRRTT